MDDREVSFRLLRHYASSVRHHKYYGMDVVIVRVEAYRADIVRSVDDGTPPTRLRHAPISLLPLQLGEIGSVETPVPSQKCVGIGYSVGADQEVGNDSFSRPACLSVS